MGIFNSVIIIVIIGFQFSAEMPQPQSSVESLAAQHPPGRDRGLFRSLFAALRRLWSRSRRGPSMEYNQMMAMQRRGNETYYDPYWPNGEWVFHREEFTQRPLLYLKHYKNLSPELLKACVEPCLRVYENYGEVCGQMIHTGDGIIKTKEFDNICHMIFDSCHKARTQAYKNYGDPWTVLFFGSCNNRWKIMPDYDYEVVSDTNYIVEMFVNNTTTER